MYTPAWKFCSFSVLQTGGWSREEEETMAMVKIATVPITGIPSEIAETLREQADRMGPSGHGCVTVGVQVYGVFDYIDAVHRNMDSDQLRRLADSICPLEDAMEV